MLMCIIRQFTNGLSIRHRKGILVFEDKKYKKKVNHARSYEFDSKEYEEFIYYFKYALEDAWPGITKLPLDLKGSDYTEYHDHNVNDQIFMRVMRHKIVFYPSDNYRKTLYCVDKKRAISLYHILYYVLLPTIENFGERSLYRGWNEGSKQYIYGEYIFESKIIDGKEYKHWIIRDDGFRQPVMGITLRETLGHGDPEPIPFPDYGN